MVKWIHSFIWRLRNGLAVPAGQLADRRDAHNSVRRRLRDLQCLLRNRLRSSRVALSSTIRPG
jgi:hypothetical protein